MTQVREETIVWWADEQGVHRLIRRDEIETVTDIEGVKELVRDRKLIRQKKVDEATWDELDVRAAYLNGEKLEGSDL